MPDVVELSPAAEVKNTENSITYRYYGVTIAAPTEDEQRLILAAMPLLSARYTRCISTFTGVR
jgi:hypothetical protein